MIDLLLLAGSAICVISVIMAIVAVAQTRAPRGAAIALMLGVALLLFAAKSDPGAVNPQNVLDTWQRGLRGEITLRGPVSAPAQTAGDAAAASGDGETGTEGDAPPAQ